MKTFIIDDEKKDIAKIESYLRKNNIASVDAEYNFAAALSFLETEVDNIELIIIDRLGMPEYEYEGKFIRTGDDLGKLDRERRVLELAHVVEGPDAATHQDDDHQPRNDRPSDRIFTDVHAPSSLVIRNTSFIAGTSGLRGGGRPARRPASNAPACPLPGRGCPR